MQVEASITKAARSRFRRILFVLLALAATLQSPLLAQEKPPEPWEKGSLSFGGFISTFDSSIAIGVNKIGGITIDGESVLGLETSLTVFRGNAMIRPGKSRRHQVDFDYASYKRSGNTVLTEEIEIGDDILLPGTAIQSTLDFDIIRGTYSYALLQDDRMRLALGLGVYVVPLRYGVQVSDPNDPRALQIEDVTLPLPSLALRADFQLVPKLFLTSDINAMYLKIDNFEGRLMDINVGLEYRPWKYLGLGVGYSATSVIVEAEEATDYPGADFVGSVDVNFTGLILYAKFTF